MSYPAPAAEILIRVNLARGLSDGERAALARLAARAGGMERAAEAALRRGLALRRAGEGPRREAGSTDHHIS